MSKYRVVHVGFALWPGWQQVVLLEVPSRIARWLGARERERTFVLDPGTATNWSEVEGETLRECTSSWRLYLCRLVKENGNSTT